MITLIAILLSSMFLGNCCLHECMAQDERFPPLTSQPTLAIFSFKCGRGVHQLIRELFMRSFRQMASFFSGAWIFRETAEWRFLNPTRSSVAQAMVPGQTGL